MVLLIEVLMAPFVFATALGLLTKNFGIDWFNLIKWQLINYILKTVINDIILNV